MSIWPKPESNMIPEGHYVFQLRAEPTFEEWDFTDKNGDPRTGRKIHIEVVGANGAGEFNAKDNFPVWDKRYADLCAVLGVEHGRDIHMAGAKFEADIKYEPDRKDPAKSWPRIINIVSANSGEPEFPEAGADKGGDDDIPF